MANKKKSGKSPLFPLYDKSMTFRQCFVVFVIFFGELLIMYLIQNNFQSAKMRMAGIVLLVLSLVLSATAIIGYCRYLKRRKQNK